MENNFNKLLLRQIKRHFRSPDNIPEELKGIFQDINNTYNSFDDDTQLIQNSIELSSQELRDAYQKQKNDAEVQKETINKIKEAIYALTPSDKKSLEKSDPALSDSNYLFDSLIRLIEERKQVEEKLRNLSQAVEQSPVSIVITDTDGNIQYGNPIVFKLAGYEPDELLGKNTRIFSSGETPMQEYKHLWESISSGREWKGEFHNKKKNGELYWELATISAVKNKNGEIVNYLAVKEDITGRKQMNKALSESEKKYREVVENVKEIIFQTDTDGNWLFLNNAWEEITGYSVEESLGQLFVKYVHPDDRQRNMDLFEPMIMRKKDYCRHQIRYLTKDGGFRWVEVFARLGLNEKNETTGTYGTLQDITERKQAEEELEQISTRLSLATRAGRVGVWDYDLVNNILLWDDEMFALYGISRENFNGAYETWKAGIHPDDLARFDKGIMMAISGEKELDTEFRVVWPDGAIHNIRALATVLRNHTGKAFRMIGTNWDITEQKKAEVVLLNAKHEAEAANKAKSIFLANMSHEIRTPLNAIIGFSQLMNRDPLLTPAQKEYNISIIRAGEHLLALINDILELSKMEAGHVELNPTNVDLYSLFNDIQMIFKERAQSKHLKFTFETASDLPQYVIVDDGKLRQIFVNLIGNAIKFTDKGSIVVRARREKINENTSNLVVEIQDSGMGISKDEFGKLFKQFEQTSSGINKSSGTGLGLALSRELAIIMGGNISLTSEGGKGSVFTFYVEIKEGKTETVEKKSTKRVICIDKGEQSYRILVADDREENLQVVVNLLKLVGFETNEAVNGEDAIKKFEEWDPHLILMDMRMPVLDGYEATRIIKSSKKGKTIPIIALTASSFEEERTKTIALGMQGYIRKPFQESELFGTIGNVLGIKFIYDEEAPYAREKYLSEDGSIHEDMAKLPRSLILKMQNAVDIADFDLLVKLINSIDHEHSELSQHLLSLANNFDYYSLQQILIQKEMN